MQNMFRLMYLQVTACCVVSSCYLY